MTCLEIHPKLRGCAEEAGEPERGIWGDSARAAHNLIHPPRRHSRSAREPVLSDTERFQELLTQYLARVNTMRGSRIFFMSHRVIS